MQAIIGYWGYADTDETRSALNKLLSRIAGADGKKQRTINSSFRPASHAFFSFVSEITFIGDLSKQRAVELSDKALTASLSASGLCDEADIHICAEKDSLKLSRDSFGRITLFWTKQHGAIWFSTQIHLLLSLLESKQVSTSGLYAYSCFSYVPAPLTPVKDIFSIPAGTQLSIKRNGLSGSSLTETLTRTHEWREAKELMDDEEQGRLQLRRLLEEDIETQISDIGSEPAGIFLSGGLDSSIAAALLARSGIRLRAYALDFGEYGKSELPEAELVATHLNIPLVKVPASPRHIRKAIRATSKALDLPFGDGVTVPLYLLSHAASRECSVIFNGEGGDQLFAGWTNKPIIASGIYAAHALEENNFYDAYLKTFHRLHGYESSAFTSEVLSETQELDPLNWIREAIDESLTPSLLHRLRRANLMLKGAQNIQPRATNLAFAYGLNVRSPFCYKPLALWSFQIAGELFLRGPCEKYLLKRAVEDMLPSDIVWREKRGMGVPLTQWLTGPLWREIGAWLAPEILEREGRWQTDLALKVALGRLSGHRQGRRIGEILWLLMMWQAWRKTIFGEDIRKPFYNPFWLRPRWWEWRMSRKEESAWQQM